MARKHPGVHKVLLFPGEFARVLTKAEVGRLERNTQSTGRLQPAELGQL